MLTSLLFGEQTNAVKEYIIPGHGVLKLAIPDGWQVSTKTIQRPSSVFLHITPQSGDAFDIQLTAVWLDAAALAQTNDQSIETNTQASANEMLQQAVEKTVVMKELRGRRTTGHYYALTDRNPAPGEHKYMLQGSFLTGEILSMFTILYRVPGPPEIGLSLRMFGDSSYSK